MRSVYEERLAEANEIRDAYRQARDTIVPAPYWTVFARYIWPEKTAAQLAASLVATNEQQNAGSLVSLSLLTRYTQNYSRKWANARVVKQ